MKRLRKFVMFLVGIGLVLLSGSSLKNNDTDSVIDKTTNKEAIDTNKKSEIDGPGFKLEEYGISPSLFDGSGTEADPYLISNMQDLQDLSDFTEDNSTDGKYFKLMADITIGFDALADFDGIGNFSNAFRGDFDGNNHTINFSHNWVVSSETSYRGHYIGLFGYVNSDETLHNLTLNANYNVKFLATSDAHNHQASVMIGGLAGIIDICCIHDITCNSKINLGFKDDANYNMWTSSQSVGGLAGQLSVYHDIDIDIGAYDISVTTEIDYFTESKVVSDINLINKSSEGCHIGGFAGSLWSSDTIMKNIKVNDVDITYGNNNYDNQEPSCISPFVGFIVDQVSYNLQLENVIVNVKDIGIYANNAMNFAFLTGEIKNNAGGEPGVVSYKNIKIRVANDISISCNLNDTMGDSNFGVIFGEVYEIGAKLENSSIVFKSYDVNLINNTATTYAQFGVVSASSNNLSDYSKIISMINSYVYEESGTINFTSEIALTYSKYNLVASRTVPKMTELIENSYIYINKTPDATIYYNDIASSSTFFNSDTSILYTNMYHSGDFYGLVSEYTASDLDTLNSYVRSKNADGQNYFAWGQIANHNNYPVFATNNVTLVAEGFDNRIGYYLPNEIALDETLLTYEGKEVEGLYLDNGFTTAVTVAEINASEENLTVYVKFTSAGGDDEEEEESGPSLPIGTEFDIIYDTKDGTINDSNYVTSYVCGIGAKLPTSVTKANYDFAGWSYRNLNGVIISEISPRQYGDVYLNANYTISANAKKYTIEYVNNEGKINGDYKTSYLDEEVELPTDVTSDYGKFVGWYDNPEFTGRRVYKISDTDTGNKTYYARYMFNRYEIDYEVSDSEEIVDYYYYEEEVTLLNNFTKDGYTFVGLSETKDDDTNLVTKINKGESGDKTYYVIYKENAKVTNLTWLWILLGVVGLGTIGGLSFYIIKKHGRQNV